MGRLVNAHVTDFEGLAEDLIETGDSGEVAERQLAIH